MRHLVFIGGFGALGVSLTLAFLYYSTSLVQRADSTETTQEAGVVDKREEIPPIIPNEAEDKRVMINALNLNGRNLTTVSGEVFKERELTRLDLSHNQLTGALPAEVRYLSRLTVLDLSDNQFTGVPAEIGQLAQLEQLDLSNNQLTGLPHELGNLKKLKILDLRGNRPSEFDLEIIKKGLPDTTILVDE